MRHLSLISEALASRCCMRRATPARHAPTRIVGVSHFGVRRRETRQDGARRYLADTPPGSLPCVLSRRSGAQLLPRCGLHALIDARPAAALG
jgi:hypothetical protein